MTTAEEIAELRAATREAHEALQALADAKREAAAQLGAMTTRLADMLKLFEKKAEEVATSELKSMVPALRSVGDELLAKLAVKMDENAVRFINRLNKDLSQFTNVALGINLVPKPEDIGNGSILPRDRINKVFYDDGPRDGRSG